MYYEYSVKQLDGSFDVSIRLRPVDSRQIEHYEMAAEIAATGQVLPSAVNYQFCLLSNGRGVRLELWTEDTPTSDYVQGIAELAQLVLTMALDDTIKLAGMLDALSRLGGSYFPYSEIIEHISKREAKV